MLGPGGTQAMPPLAELRQRKPWTQKELADAAGVSENTIWVIENRRHGRVRPRVVRAIAQALGVEPGQIAEFRPLLGLPPEGEGKALAA